MTAQERITLLNEMFNILNMNTSLNNTILSREDVDGIKSIISKQIACIINNLKI